MHIKRKSSENYNILILYSSLKCIFIAVRFSFALMQNHERRVPFGPYRIFFTSNLVNSFYDICSSPPQSTFKLNASQIYVLVLAIDSSLCVLFVLTPRHCNCFCHLYFSLRTEQGTHLKLFIFINSTFTKYIITYYH